MLDAEPDRWDLSQMKGMLVGGSAAPRAMIAGFKQRHGLSVVHGWGMTETSPVASTAQLPGDARRGRRGDAVRLHRDAGTSRCRSSSCATATSTGTILPWDGESMGELEMRGPWVAAAYYDTPEQAERWTDDGWFKTGDVVSIHPLGFIQIKDRSKDVIKSGGEWISSVELENALMAHPAIAEAAVIAVPDAKWDERPLAAVVLREGATATADELRAFLAPDFAKWWLPDRFEFIAEIPKTSVGKFRKTELREMFAPERRRRRRDRDRLARQPAGQRGQRGIIETLWTTFERPRRRRARRRAARQGRARVLGRRRHQRLRRRRRRRRAPRRHPAGGRPDRAGAGARSSRRSTATASAAASRSRSRATSASRTRDAQLGFPEVNLGLLPGGGGTQRAPRLISPGRARWLTMSGERIPAETAEAWGLVEFVVDDLEEGIARYVEPLDHQSPHAIRQIKELLARRRATSAATSARCRRSPPASPPRRAGGRRRVPREARAPLDRPVKAVVLREVDGDLALEDVPEPTGDTSSTCARRA